MLFIVTLLTTDHNLSSLLVDVLCRYFFLGIMSDINPGSGDDGCSSDSDFSDFVPANRMNL